METSNKKIIITVIISYILIVIAIITIVVVNINQSENIELIEPEETENNEQEELEDNDEQEEQDDSKEDNNLLSQLDVEEELFTIEGNEILISKDILLDEVRNNYSATIIGRLEVPSLFNVLVVQGKDNVYYLNHDINNDYDIGGTEFLDYRVSIDSQQINIYGNNNKDNAVKMTFSLFENFLDKEFFDSNPYIIFQNDNGKNIYKIVAIKKQNNNEHMNINVDKINFVNHIKEMITGETVVNSREALYDENSSVLVIQTCLEGTPYIITAIKI